MTQLCRPKYPKQKNVLIINDIPTKGEVASGDRFSAVSNMNLLSSLTTGRVYMGSSKEDHIGVSPIDIYGTYLDYNYFEEGNYDFKNDFKKRKDLRSEENYFFLKEDFSGKEETQYYKLPHQNDCYISHRLFVEFQSLLNEIQKVNPKIIVVTGKWGLFLLTGCTTIGQNMGTYKDRKPFGGLNKFRSSIMEIHPCWNLSDIILIPIYHPVNAVAMPDKVPIMELDLQKIGWIYNDVKENGTEKYLSPKDKEYLYSTNFEEVIHELSGILLKIEKQPILVSLDIETMFNGIIDCIGIAISKDRGFCIPFAKLGEPNIWTATQETEIMLLLRSIMLHPNCLHIGQNYNYDCQYYYSIWGMEVNATHDTMILHHILYNYLPKDLAFLASLYCEVYKYWKDQIEAHQETPETRWIYNAQDVCYTLEILEPLLDILSTRPEKQQELYKFQINELSPILKERMNKGIRIDKGLKEEYYKFFSEILLDIQKNINEMLGMEFNTNSSPQKVKLFRDFFGMTLKKSKKGTDTCDAKAMLSYIEEYPEYKPFLCLLLEQSSLKVFTNNFLGMKLDADNRGRTNYKISGTKTGRLSSTKNVYGTGGNYQNIPEKGKIKLVYAVENLTEGDEEDDSLLSELSYEGKIALPNIKKIFLPDPGMELADADYSGADIQIVAADSQCKWLLDYFSNPNNKMKVYKYISSMFFQREITDEEYRDQKAIYHGLNYKLGVKKLASMAGISEHLAEQLKKFYFSLNPEIPLWHERLEREIKNKHYVTNIFGRQGWFVDHKDPTLMNKVCAFIPQSSIGDLINHAIVRILEADKRIQLLMQVHDSGVFQYPIEYAEECRKNILENMVLDLPYDPILRIPADMKVSRKSYGDTTKVSKLVV